jgi:hypothetical protein
MSDADKEIITDNEENGSDRNALLRAAGGTEWRIAHVIKLFGKNRK